MLKGISILLVLMWMLGCKSVTQDDVIGTWVMTSESQQVLPPDFRKNQATLVVKTDGSFVGSGLPEELYPMPPYNMSPRMRTDSGTGVWRLASREGKQLLVLEFKDLLSPDENRRGSYGFPLAIARNGGAVNIYYFLGDPDQGRRVGFEKK